MRRASSGGSRARIVLIEEVILAVEVHEPVGTFADGMDRHDVRVRQTRRGLRLAEEPHADFLAERELRRQDLDGHFPLESLVARVVDDAHAAAADLAFERE